MGEKCAAFLDTVIENPRCEVYDLSQHTKGILMRFPLQIIPLLLLTSCHSTLTPFLEAAAVHRLTESTYPPLPADAPVYLTTGDLDTAYEEVAIIAVWPPGNRDFQSGQFEQLNHNLQRQARTVGANAVIRIHYDLRAPADGAPYATGTAVRVPER